MGVSDSGGTCRGKTTADKKKRNADSIEKRRKEGRSGKPVWKG